MPDKYKVFTFDPFIHPFNLEIVGTTMCDKFYVQSRSKAPNYIFEYITRGSGYLINNSVKYTLNKGDVFILHKGSNHSYYPDKDNLWTKIWFDVDGTLVQKLLEVYELCDTVVVNDFNKSSLFEEIYNIANSDLDVDKILNFCEIKFFEILRELHLKNISSKIFDKTAYKIKCILDNNIYAKINLLDIGKTLFISSAQMINLFKKEYGKTPHQYLIEKRIATSTILLKSTSLSINQISEQLNFADQHYFSNVFKKITGVTPRDYRRSFNE